MSKVYFLTGSQFLYGEDTLRQVAQDSKKIVAFLDKKIERAEIVWVPTLKTSEEITAAIKQANADDECIGIITWMHTFSPSKMWIHGFSLLQKPYLHLHTQANRELPYAAIDMDFMNLNQSAHGDREHGFIAARMKKARKVVVGYYEDDEVIDKISTWIDVCCAYAFSQNMKVVRFGDNMRDVAVTEGDKVEAEMQFGWSVNTFPVGDLVQEIAKVTEEETEAAYEKFLQKYRLNTKNTDSFKVQVKYYLAMAKFLADKKASAFTNTFEDLHGMEQLPGFASQELMVDGIGYGAEGDWKTAALDAVMMKLAEGRTGGTGFMEDYTYDFTRDLVLGSHMLEVSPQFARETPKIEVHPLGIGNRKDPARLVFDGITGTGIACSLIDLGNRFRLIVAEIELVQQPKEMPNLPVARVMWKLKPDLKRGAQAWILAGGAHHTVVSTAVTTEDMQDFARIAGIECVVIDDTFTVADFEQKLMLGDVVYR